MAQTVPDRSSARPDEALDPIEAEVERDRADLLGTVEALRRRLSGESVRSGLGRRAREGAASGVAQRVSDHPLETVAIGAAVAYPLVRIVSKIPAPILLLGAGVALAGRGGSKGRSGGEIDVAIVEEVEVAEYDAPRSAARDPHVSPLATAGAQGSSRPSAGASMGDRAAATGERVVAAGRAGQRDVIEAIQRHPAAAAGLGLLIGGALAAMLPRSRAENRLFGEAGQEARDRARALALEGIESGRRVVDAAREEAEDQDLTPEAARRVAEDAKSRAKAATSDAAKDVSAVASKDSK